MTRGAPMPCAEKAVALLARRPHFRRELARKLTQRGYEESEVEAALDRLTTRGLLDDRQLAHDYLAQRLRREPLGRRRLAAELARRGVDAELVEEALAAQLPEDDLELARQAAARWQQRGGGDPRKLARHLERRGFSPHAIFALLHEMPDPSDPDF